MAAVSSIVAAAALAATAASAYEQRKQAKTAAKERKEAAAIGSAEQQAQQMDQRRQQLREERVRRAQILQASENTGVSASSGQLGSVSALGANTGANVSSLSRQANSALGIGAASQRAANADLRSQEAAAIGGIASNVFGTAIGIRMSQGPTPAAPQTEGTSGGNFSPTEVPNPYDNNIFTRKQ